MLLLKLSAVVYLYTRVHFHIATRYYQMQFPLRTLRLENLGVRLGVLPGTISHLQWNLNKNWICLQILDRESKWQKQLSFALNSYFDPSPFLLPSYSCFHGVSQFLSLGPTHIRLLISNFRLRHCTNFTNWDHAGEFSPWNCRDGSRSRRKTTREVQSRARSWKHRSPSTEDLDSEDKLVEAASEDVNHTARDASIKFPSTSASNAKE